MSVQDFEQCAVLKGKISTATAELEDLKKATTIESTTVSSIESVSPAVKAKETELATFEAKLQTAMSVQDFEQCAAIKAQITTLKAEIQDLRDSSPTKSRLSIKKTVVNDAVEVLDVDSDSDDEAIMLNPSLAQRAKQKRK